MKIHHPRRSAIMHVATAFLFLVIGAGIVHAAQARHPDIKPAAGMDLYGSILDNTGAPVAGVVVSDGFQCVATDACGVYQMKRNPKARMVYYSTPAEYIINTRGKPGKGGLGKLHAKLTNARRYNFDLIKLSAPEKEFTLICVGDPQARHDADLKRYKNETLADLAAFAKAARPPCYAILLGDVIFDTPQFLNPMREITARAGIPYFAVIGNHDHDEAITDDRESAAAFERTFGPLNFSFNRGGVHIIGMDDILYEGKKRYKLGFTDEQVEWLRQNLSFVPKDKTIVLAYHAPLRESGDRGAANREKLMRLFAGYADVHIMAGHTHYHENHIIEKPVKAYGHIHGTACGAWWRSTLNTDGTPNGYAPYTFNGNKIVNWHYKAVGYGPEFQMRMYRGDASFGGPGGTFSYRQTANDVIVDVWNADSEWKIVACENGIETGPLKKLPRMVDAYAAGIHVGVLQRSAKSYDAEGAGTNKHLYIYTLKDPDARVEIRATDRFGATYSVKEFTTDLSAAAKYNK